MTFRLKHFLIAFIAVAVAAASFGAFAVQKAQALTPLSAVQAGDLIRGEATPSVYYMGADGFRYVFPNSKTYFTWYDNFDSVIFLSDADLGKVQLGNENVNYKPGTRMVKIQSDPATYAVDAGGELRHVTSEAVAIALFGSDWNKQIDDVPDSFFGSYALGDRAINSSSDYSASAAAAAATSINANKSLVAPKEITVGSGGYSPIDATVSAGQTVRFTNTDTQKHTATGDNLSWGTGTMQPGGSFVAIFEEAGTYPFFDSYDGSNTGAIFVQ